MKSILVTFIAVGLTGASAISRNQYTDADASVGIHERATGDTANDYINGGCRDIIYFFARGTGDSGNLVCKSRKCHSQTNVLILC